MKFVLVAQYFSLVAGGLANAETGSILQTKSLFTSEHGHGARVHASNLQAIDQMVTKLEQSPNALTVDELKLVTDLITTLENEFETELGKQSLADSSSYEKKKAQHVACSTHKEKRLHQTSGDIAIAKGRIARFKAKHKACRKAEKSLGEYKSAANSVQQGTWGSLAGVPGVAETSADGTLCTSRNTWRTDLSSYKKILPANTVSASCGTDQSHVEVGFCDWLVAKTTMCLGFDECISSVALATAKTDVGDQIKTRRDLWHSIQKLKCRLQHIGNHKVFGKTGVTADNCDNVAAPDAAKFSLTLDIPSHTTCSDDPDITAPVQPSQDTTKCSSWISQEYDYSSTEYVSVTSCQEYCTVPTIIVTNPSVPGCEDTNDVDKQCPFYNLHFDACGKYDDGAAANCCSCGGGSIGSGPTGSGSTGSGSTGSSPEPAPAPAPTPAPPGAWVQVAWLAEAAPAKPAILSTAAAGDAVGFSTVNSKMSDADINTMNFDIVKMALVGKDAVYFNLAGRDWMSMTKVEGCTEYAESEQDALDGKWQQNKDCCLYKVCNFGEKHCGGTISNAWGFSAAGEGTGCGFKQSVGGEAHYYVWKPTTTITGPAGIEPYGCKALADTTTWDKGPLHIATFEVCAIMDDGKVSCNSMRTNGGFSGRKPPDANTKFSMVGNSGNSNYMCGILLEDQSIFCWGFQGTKATLPAGKFKTVEVGTKGGCAVTITDTVKCFGKVDGGHTYVEDSPDPPADLGKVRRFKMGYSAACAINQTFQLHCWGYRTTEMMKNMPHDSVGWLDVFVGPAYPCAIRASNNKIACWSSVAGKTWPAFEEDETIFAGDRPSLLGEAIGLYGHYYNDCCAVMKDRTVRCWGRPGGEGEGMARGAALVGKVKSLAYYDSTVCAITDEDAVKCWVPAAYGTSDGYKWPTNGTTTFTFSGNLQEQCS